MKIKYPNGDKVDTAQHTPGPMEKWLHSSGLLGFPGSGKYDDALAIARKQDADRDRLIEQNTALLAALEAIKARGEAWLASDHDYSTSYADRRDGDRAANTMLAIARDAIAKAGA